MSADTLKVKIRNVIGFYALEESALERLADFIRDREQAAAHGTHSPCCGDAHLELQAAMAMIADLGFISEETEAGGIRKIIWSNKRAEEAEEKLLSSDQYLRDRNEETEILRKQCIELNRKVQAAKREAMERAAQIADNSVCMDCECPHKHGIAAAIRAEAAKIGGGDGT